MGIWRGLRVAFVLGSLFMILLIIVYWDDIGGFNLYPLQDHKHRLLQGGPCPRTTAASSLPSRSSSSLAVPTTASSTKPTPERTRGAEEEQKQEEKEEVEEEEEDKHEQTKEEVREDEEKVKESSHTPTPPEDGDQETRKQRILDVCSGRDNVEFTGRTRAFEQIPNRELDHLIVDDTHQIIYCYVPKVQAQCVYEKTEVVRVRKIATK